MKAFKTVIFSTYDARIIEIDNSTSPLDVGKCVLKGIGNSLIVKLFSAFEIRKCLDLNQKKAVLSSNPDLLKSDSLITPFDVLRLLNISRTAPNFAVLSDADQVNYSIFYPHLTSDDFTHGEIAILFGAYIYQGKKKTIYPFYGKLSFIKYGL